MTEPDQWAKELANEAYHQTHLNGKRFAALTIQRAFEERLHIELAKHSLAENTAKATEAARARGYKIDPRLVDLEDRAWASTRQDAPKACEDTSHDQ